MYYYICDCYDSELRWVCQRFSNNSTEPDFTDAELLTIYLFVMREEEKFKISSIYQYAQKYLKTWFPDLPSYKAFNNRLNRLADAFPMLVSLLLKKVKKSGVELDISLVDSFPIITCSHKRAGKVATELTNKSYCSTKQLYYYGAKLHCIAFRCPGALPLPEYLGLTQASVHDLTAVRYIFDIKAKKGESEELRAFLKAGREVVSTAVSKVRQPIESLFNWIIEKTDIQRASKVRSSKGLIVHVFGRLAMAISLWVF